MTRFFFCITIVFKSVVVAFPRCNLTNLHNDKSWHTHCSSTFGVRMRILNCLAIRYDGDYKIVFIRGEGWAVQNKQHMCAAIPHACWSGRWWSVVVSHIALRYDMWVSGATTFSVIFEDIGHLVHFAPNELVWLVCCGSTTSIYGWLNIYIKKTYTHKYLFAHTWWRVWKQKSQLDGVVLGRNVLWGSWSMATF